MYERKHQWDFKIDKGESGPHALAYLYLDGKEGPNVAVGQNYRGHWNPTHMPDILHGEDVSHYEGDKIIPATVVNPKDNRKYTVTKIAEWAFIGAANVHKVSLPSTIEEIEDAAFDTDVRLYSIDLNEGLKKIGYHAFLRCIGLSSITIPDSVTYIGNGAFLSCQSMERAVIGAGVSSMDKVFQDCGYLKEVTCRAVNPPAITERTFEDKVCGNATLYVPFLSYEAYKKDSMWGKFRKIEPIPETIPATGQFYFMVDGIRYKTKGDNSNEVYVAPLENGVYDEKKMGSNMAGVYVAPDASQAGHRPASPRAPKPAGIEIPSQVQFAGKTYVVTGIDKHAFSESKVSTVKIPNTVKDIAYAAFKNAKITKIEIPSSVQFIKDSAFFGCENLTEVDVPGSVAYIEDSAFGYCKNLNKITLHKGLTRIGDCAFEGAKEVQQLTIPNTVIEIGASAFHQVGNNNPNRLALTIPDSVTAIGSNAFFECRIKKLTLGLGLTKIENGVFRKSELKELVIPAKITSIGKKAFADNDNNLQIIVCQSAIPPKIEDDTFDSPTFKNATLNIPSASYDAYKNDAVWGKFSQFGYDVRDENPVNPEPISEITEPIRYIKIINNGEIFTTVILHSSSGDITVGEVHQKDLTLDIAYNAKTQPEKIRPEDKVWIEIVVNRKSQIASQRFILGMESNKKANYTIESSTLVLSYTGLTTY